MVMLDEYILQVFEEQEDQFHFPVVSQKTARSFVKALHTKGLAFEDIGKEIDEFEHNFSAWRKGLGRVGIGARSEPVTRARASTADLSTSPLCWMLSHDMAVKAGRPSSRRRRSASTRMPGIVRGVRGELTSWRMPGSARSSDLVTLSRW